MTLVCKSVGIGDGIVNPIHRYGVEITPDINPRYVGLERSCPRDSKNVPYVGMGLVKTCLDLILSYGWWGGGLSKNLVKPIYCSVTKTLHFSTIYVKFKHVLQLIVLLLLYNC